MECRFGLEGKGVGSNGARQAGDLDGGSQVLTGSWGMERWSLHYSGEGYSTVLWRVAM